MKKFILSIGFILFFLVQVIAQNDPMKGQDSLVLELERNEWLPESQKFKVDFPKINLTLPPKLPYFYTSDSFAHQPKMILPTLKVDNLQKPTLEKLYQGYAKISFSSLLQPSVIFNVNQGRTTNLDWGFCGNYEGLLKNYVPNSNRHYFQLEGHAGWHKELWSFKTQLQYQRWMFNYFGDSTYQAIQPASDSIRSNFSAFQWNNDLIYGNSLSGFYANIPLNCIFYSDKWKNHEFHLLSNPDLSYSFQKFKLGIQGRIQNVSLKNEWKQNSRLLLEANPYGEVNMNLLKLRLGLQWMKVDSLGFILPELLINYQVFPKQVQAFLGIKGEGTLNSLWETKRLYPYLESNFHQQSSITPWKIFAGGKLSVHQWSLNLMGYYKKVNHLMIIYGTSLDGILQERWVKQGYLTAIYDGAARIYGLDFSAEWKHQEYVRFSLEMNYQNWILQNYEYNFHQPNLRLQFIGEYLLNKKFEFFSIISYISMIRLGYLLNNSVINQKGVILADLKFSYRFNENFSIFVGGNNLLNQKYFLLRDYQEIPIHGYAGIRILF